MFQKEKRHSRFCILKGLSNKQNIFHVICTLNTYRLKGGNLLKACDRDNAGIMS